MKRNVALVAMVLACLLVGTSAFAVVIGNVRPVTIGASGEPPLFFDGRAGLLDALADPTQLSADYFVPNNTLFGATQANFTLGFRFAGNSNAISMYNLNNTAEQLMIFQGSDPAYNTNGTIGLPTLSQVTFTQNISGAWNVVSPYGSNTFDTPAFGFLLNSAGTVFYGDDFLNTNNEAHMLVFKGIGQSTNGYWFAFEDLAFASSDRDYNDVVFYGESIQPVPEPGTMMLLGSGLVGLAGWGRKKFRK